MPPRKLEAVGVNSVREIIVVDIVGKLPTTAEGFAYVCTITDVFSPYLVAYKLRNTTNNAIIKCMDTYFLHLGLPTALLSDNGPCFMSHRFLDTMKCKRVKV